MIGAPRARRCSALRGGIAGMVFQEPMTSLNPLHRIGRQVAEAITLHRRCASAALRARVIELLRPGRLPRRRATGSTPFRTSFPAASASG